MLSREEAGAISTFLKRNCYVAIRQATPLLEARFSIYLAAGAN